MWSDHHFIPPMRGAGRFAPTPTGNLHVGNAYSALLALVSAHAHDLTCLIRIDDLDTVRVSARDYTPNQLQDLAWLGLKFDEGLSEGGKAGPYRQSQRFSAYESALQYLNERGLLYPCYCTRKEIIAAAPHAQDEGYVYPLICRPVTPQKVDLEQVRRTSKRGRLPSLRLNVGALKLSRDWSLSSDEESSRVIRYQDLIYGEQHAHLDEDIGDFVLQRSDGIYGYQLACAVDDYLQGCHLVARGADLITSTHRQRLILAALDLPFHLSSDYAHAGLVVDQHGERLSKRNQSTSLAGLREQGVSSGAVRASLSRALGGPDSDLLERMIKSFHWGQISQDTIVWSLEY